MNSLINLIEILKTNPHFGNFGESIEISDNVNVNDEYGITPLHVADLKGYFDICKMLLALGTHVSIRTHCGYTAADFINGKVGANYIGIAYY